MASVILMMECHSLNVFGCLKQNLQRNKHRSLKTGGACFYFAVMF